MVFSLLLLIVAAIGGGLYVAYLDHTVRGQFEGKRWALPAYVYARPLELFPGARLSAAQLEQELRLLDYRPANGPLRAGTYTRNDGRIRFLLCFFFFWVGFVVVVVLVFFFVGFFFVVLCGLF